MNGERTLRLPELPAETPVGFIGNVPVPMQDPYSRAPAAAPCADQLQRLVQIGLPRHFLREQLEQPVGDLGAGLYFLPLGDVLIDDDGAGDVLLLVPDGERGVQDDLVRPVETFDLYFLVYRRFTVPTRQPLYSPY